MAYLARTGIVHNMLVFGLSVLERGQLAQPNSDFGGKLNAGSTFVLLPQSVEQLCVYFCVAIILVQSHGFSYE